MYVKVGERDWGDREIRSDDNENGGAARDGNDDDGALSPLAWVESDGAHSNDSGGAACVMVTRRTTDDDE